MESPRQSPPVDRPYMRLLVGKKSPPHPAYETGRHAAAEKGKSSRRKQVEPETPAREKGAYLLELSVFHVRRRGGAF
jgi:hypothetical protein